MIDIHSHLLYGIDDGPKTKDESLDMLKIAAKDGISTIIATPHYIYGANRYSKETLIDHYEEIREAIVEEKIPIDLLLGNEMFLDEYVVEAILSGDCLTLGDSPFVLVEYYQHAAVHSIKPILYELMLKHYQPIIAHVERFIHNKNDVNRLKELQEWGCLFQINASSITHPRNGVEKKLILHMIEEDMIQFIASDAHNTKKRKPNLKNAYTIVSKKIGQDMADHVFIKNPQMLLSTRGNDKNQNYRRKLSWNDNI